MLKSNVRNCILCDYLKNKVPDRYYLLCYAQMKNLRMFFTNFLFSSPFYLLFHTRYFYSTPQTPFWIIPTKERYAQVYKFLLFWLSILGLICTSLYTPMMCAFTHLYLTPVLNG